MSNEELLFREAIENVRKKRDHPDLNKFIMDQFGSSQTSEDFLRVFEKCRTSNRVLRIPKSSSWLHKLARWSDHFLGAFKAVGDSAVKSNQTIAAPVWGVFCAVLDIIRSVLKVGDKLNSLTERIEGWKDLYSSLIERCNELDPHVRRSLLRFNEVVIEFSFNIGLILSETTAKTWGRLADKSLQDEMDRIERELGATTTAAHHAVTMELHKDMKEVKLAQTFPIPSRLSSPSTGVGRTQTFRVPDRLSKHFTGRLQELSDIERMLNRQVGQKCQKCALVGIGGVGKTQLALRYIDANANKQYRQILWVCAESKAVLQNEIAFLAERLGICDSLLARTEKALVVERLKSHLQETQNWLLVFDNLMDSNDVLPYLPSSGTGHIIFTCRQQSFADTLVSEDNIVKVNAFEEHNGGLELVFRLMSWNPPTQTENAWAEKIVKTAGGLPLAIEQVVGLHKFSHDGWNKILEDVAKKSALLKMQNFGSNHEHNLSTAAIVANSLTTMESKDSYAAALYKLLVYLSPSSIPVTLLLNAKQNLQEYFRREHTFTKGQLRSKADLVRINNLTEDEKRPFCLWDYDPFERDIYMKILGLGEYHSRYRNATLPRVDSDSDIELQNFWTSDFPALQAVLDSSENIDYALNKLERLGLIRRFDEAREVWIHDVYSDLTKDIIKFVSRKTHQNLAHATATMVFLALPVPLYPHSRTSIRLLPHAISTHGHLESTGILRSSTVGPELSHLIASTIASDFGVLKTGETIGHRDRIEKVSFYFECALAGYSAALTRLRELKGVTMERIALATFIDYVREDEISLYNPERYSDSTERFGRSALWRCIQTMTRFGGLLWYYDRSDRAIPLLEMAVAMSERVFGTSHTDTMCISEELLNIRKSRAEWEKAYDLARRRAEAVMGIRGTRLLGPKLTAYMTQQKIMPARGYEYSNMLPHALVKTGNKSTSTQEPDADGASYSEVGQYRWLSSQRLLRTGWHSMFRILAAGPASKKDIPVKPPVMVTPPLDCCIAADLGYISSHVPGKETESLFWNSIALQSRQFECGANTIETVSFLSTLSQAYLKVATTQYTDDLDSEAASDKQVKQADNLRNALYYALHAVKVSIDGKRAGFGPHYKGNEKLDPTIQEVIKANGVMEATTEPEDEEEQKKIDRDHRREMKDTRTETMIEKLREMQEKIPGDVLDRFLRIRMDEVENKITEWKIEQDFWQKKEGFCPKDGWTGDTSVKFPSITLWTDPMGSVAT